MVAERGGDKHVGVRQVGDSGGEEQVVLCGTAVDTNSKVLLFG